jgi:hypothetical protein
MTMIAGFRPVASGRLRWPDAISVPLGYETIFDAGASAVQTPAASTAARPETNISFLIVRFLRSG